MRGGRVQEKAPSSRAAMASTAWASWSRSVSVPSSMTCRGVRPAKAAFGATHQEAKSNSRGPSSTPKAARSTGSPGLESQPASAVGSPVWGWRQPMRACMWARSVSLVTARDAFETVWITIARAARVGTSLRPTGPTGPTGTATARLPGKAIGRGWQRRPGGDPCGTQVDPGRCPRPRPRYGMLSGSCVVSQWAGSA